MSSATSQNILVSGGAGYIGSHTCKALSQRKGDPVVLVSDASKYKALLKVGTKSV